MSTDRDTTTDELERIIEPLDGSGTNIATGPIANLGRLYIICHHQMEAGDLSHALRTLRTIARMERELQLDLTLARPPGPRSRRTLH